LERAAAAEALEPLAPRHACARVRGGGGIPRIYASADRGRSGAAAQLSHQAEQSEQQFRSIVGARVREERKRRGLTTRELAHLASVTQAFISQIELGRVTPSVATMYRITGALSIPMGEIFGSVGSSAEDVLTRHEWSPYSMEAGDQSAVLSLDPDGRVQLQWTCFEPGFETGGEGVAHGAEIQIIFVLRGRIELAIEGRRHVLDEHATIRFDGRLPHTWKHPTRRPAEILSITVPGLV
jgi:transcriptional regulator with XRE-family HTH domain